MYRLAVPLILVFFMIMILALTLGQGLGLLPQVVKVSELHGLAEVRPHGSEKWSPLQEGVMVKKGDYIRTRQPGHVVLAWYDGTRLVLDENTMVLVRACNVDKRRQRSRSVFRLGYGKVWLRVRTRIDPKTGSSFEIYTPHLLASVHGTIFRVTADKDRSEVAVHQGEVLVKALTEGARGVDVVAGQMARVAESPNVETSEMSPEEKAVWNARSELIAPYLRVAIPLPRQSIHRLQARVRGETDAGCTVTVNDRPVTVKEDGSFSCEIPISPGKNVLRIVSTSPEKKMTTQEREVLCEPGDPGRK